MSASSIAAQRARRCDSVHRAPVAGVSRLSAVEVRGGATATVALPSLMGGGGVVGSGSDTLVPQAQRTAANSTREGWGRMPRSLACGVSARIEERILVAPAPYGVTVTSST